MPWSVGNPPGVARSWTKAERERCVKAANAVLADGGSDQDAIFACIRAAGKSKRKGTSSMNDRTRLIEVFGGEAAQAALAGEWVRAMPVLDGGFWRGGEHRELSAEVVATIAANWARRAEIGMVDRPPVNLEHTDVAGAVGVVTDLKAEADGLYIKLAPTDKGAELLEAGAFNYLSAEIYWEYETPTTGEQAGPVFAGVALTNYPFFGEATALYSRAATERMLELGMIIEQSETGGGKMETDGGPAPDEFSRRMAEMEQRLSDFSAQLGTVTQERDAFAARVQSLETQLTAEQDGRLTERFNRQAEGYKAIGAKVSDLAGELKWLFQADKSETKAHFAWFETLLNTMDQSLAQSGAFSEAGVPGSGTPAGPAERFGALVNERMTKLGTGADYAGVVAQVARENPELYAQAYRPKAD